MLWDISKDREITKIPHKEHYDLWMPRIDPNDLAVMKQTLNDMIDGTEIQTSSWMPGSTWANTPFQPIYDDATDQDQTWAGMCFGLLVWEVFMERPEYWAFHRYENLADGLTYFQINPR